MKKIALLLIIFSSIKSFGQNRTIDSLKQQLSVAKEDSTRFSLLSNLSYSYTYLLPDSAFRYAKKELSLALNLDKKDLEVGYIDIGRIYRVMGNYPDAFSVFLKSLSISRTLKDNYAISVAHYYLGEIEEIQKNYPKALNDEYQAEYFDNRKTSLVWDYIELASIHQKAGNFDSALFYATKAKAINLQLTPNTIYDWLLYVLGNIYFERGMYQAALLNYYTAITKCIEQGTPKDLIDIYEGIAKAYKNEGKVDSAISYAYKAFRDSSTIIYPAGRLEATQSLADLYMMRNNSDSAITYLRKTIELKDGLFNMDKTRQIENLSFSEQLQQQELERSQLKYKNRLNDYLLIGSLLILLIVAGGLWRKNAYKQRSFTLLQKQKQEIDNQKQKVEKTLQELKSTQSQLIQSEKMASLGELTAGIAHEIQNPLNFVNNFSEVNKEMLEELKAERLKPKAERDEQTQDEIINDVIENAEKINHHGKRADAIVKNMLQHSRQNDSNKKSFSKKENDWLIKTQFPDRSADKDFKIL